MCRWPHCNLPTSDGSTLMCRHHAAHVDACLLGAMDLAVEGAVRARHDHHEPYVEHTERPRPPT